MTKEEINRRVATEVMGFHFGEWDDPGGPYEAVIQDAKEGGYIVSLKHSPYDWFRWNPAERWDHAGMVLEKFPLWTVRKDHGLYQCMLRKTYTYYSEWKDTAPMAISLDSIAAVNGGKD